MEWIQDNWKLLAGLIALVCATAGLTVAVTDEDGDGRPDKVVISRDSAEATNAVVDAVPGAIVVDGPDKDAVKNDVVPIGPDAREVAAEIALEENDLAGDLVGDQPTGPIAKLEPPFASEEVPGCRTRFLRTNFSSRSGVTPRWMAPHYTAGRDIPNSRADVDGLTAYGNNPAARVSWHFNIDKDGNCDYNVPLRYKAWTISNANPPTINFETAGQGEPPYLRPGGYKQLARIWKYVHQAYPGIPLRVGSISNCSSGQPGWITHWMTGVCGGSHTDIKPHDLGAVVEGARRALSSLDCNQRCVARQRQQKVIVGRKKAHAALHARHHRRGCRPLHRTAIDKFRREICRKAKARAESQHRGIARAREKMATL